MKLFAAALLALSAAATTQAAVIVTNATQYNTGYTVSNTDLLQQHLASSSFTGNFSAENTLGAAAFTNGVFGTQGNQGNGGQAATGITGNVATFNLDRAYNLSSIDSYAGWDAYRGGQSYDVYFATLANPSTYQFLATVYNDATGVNLGNTNTRANLVGANGFLATNVTSLRFNFKDNLSQGYNGYREIDVQGSAVVPEPASIALFGLALAGVALFGRRQRG
jgi:hypothetical protein